MILRGLTVEDNLMVGSYALKSYEHEVEENGAKRKLLKSVEKNTLKRCLIWFMGTFQYLKERKKQQASHFLVVNNKCLRLVGH